MLEGPETIGMKGTISLDKYMKFFHVRGVSAFSGEKHWVKNESKMPPRS